MFRVFHTGLNAFEKIAVLNRSDHIIEFVCACGEVGVGHTGVDFALEALAFSVSGRRGAKAECAYEIADAGNECTVVDDRGVGAERSLIIKKITADLLCAACTGFLAVYELGQLYIRSGKAKNVLLIGADALSRLVDWHDRGTCILFGDGAGAVVLTAEEQETKACEKIHSDGEKGVSLTCEKGTYLQMDGRAVFQFALSRVPEVIREVLKEAEVPVEEIDAFILHQANSRIIDGVAKRLKAPKEKFPRNIEAYGNTCAASIPILLDEWNRSGRAQKGQRIVLSGFGAGLIWGAAYLEW